MIQIDRKDRIMAAVFIYASFLLPVIAPIALLLEYFLYGQVSAMLAFLFVWDILMFAVKIKSISDDKLWYNIFSDLPAIYIFIHAITNSMWYNALFRDQFALIASYVVFVDLSLIDIILLSIFIHDSFKRSPL